MKKRRHLAVMLGLLSLTGCGSTECLIFCHDETSIQSDYVVARDGCQDLAQQKVAGSAAARGGDPKAMNTALLEHFAQCMKAQGWGVTSPKKTTSTPGGPNDTSNLSGAPWTPTPYGIQQAPTATARAAIPQQQPGAYGYAPPQAFGMQPQQMQAQPYGYGAYGYGYAQPAPQPYYPQPMAAPMPQAQQGYYGGYPGYEEDYGAVPADADASRAGIGLGPGYGY